MSNQDTPILPKIVYGIGLFFYVLLLMVGFLYIFRGNYILVGIGSLISFGAIVLASYQLEVQKAQKNNLKLEKSWRIIYGVIGLLLFVIVFHAISVEFINKNTIIRAAKDKLQSMENLVMDYNQASNNIVNSFKDSVESNLDTYILSGGKNTSAQGEIERLLAVGIVDFDTYKKKPRNSSYKEALRNQAAKGIEDNQERIRRRLDLAEVEDRRQLYTNQVLPVFENWQRTKVGYYYNDIDNMYSEVYNATQERIPEFEYPDALKQSEINLDNPLENITIGTLSLGLGACLVLNFLVLFPYLFFINRDENILIPSDYRDEDDTGIKLWD